MINALAQRDCGHGRHCRGGETFFGQSKVARLHCFGGGKGVVDEAAHFVVARKQKDRVQLPWPPLSALLQLCPTS